MFKSAWFLTLPLLIGALGLSPASPSLQTPGSPTGLAVIPGDVTLTWTPAAGAILQWVWSMKLDGTDYQWHQAAGDAGSLVIAGLDAGEPHQFLVIAVFAPANGNSAARWTFSNFASATPKTAPPPENTTRAIAAGGKHTCMLQDDGAAVCWGANGDADKGQADPPAGATFTAITAGYEHTCGIVADTGAAVCWGDDSSGQSTAPAGVSFTAINAGRAHTCALSTSGIHTGARAVCWGSNEYGQLDAPSGAFTAITAGGEHSCGLREDGRVECWGDDYYRQAAPPDALFYAISAGTWHTCGIKQDGSIACWGANPDGQAPAMVGGSYQAVSAGGRHACAVVTDGGSYCWGTTTDIGMNSESSQSAPATSMAVG